MESWVITHYWQAPKAEYCIFELIKSFLLSLLQAYISQFTLTVRRHSQNNLFPYFSLPTRLDQTILLAILMVGSTPIRHLIHFRTIRQGHGSGASAESEELSFPWRWAPIRPVLACSPTLPRRGWGLHSKHMRPLDRVMDTSYAKSTLARTLPGYRNGIKSC